MHKWTELARDFWLVSLLFAWPKSEFLKLTCDCRIWLAKLLAVTQWTDRLSHSGNTHTHFNNIFKGNFPVLPGLYNFWTPMYSITTLCTATKFGIVLSGWDALFWGSTTSSRGYTIYAKTSKFNVIDFLVQRLGRACQGVEAYGNNFGRTPFLPPPVTHMGTSGDWTQARWAQVRHLNHSATAANKLSMVTTLVEGKVLFSSPDPTSDYRF